MLEEAQDQKPGTHESGRGYYPDRGGRTETPMTVKVRHPVTCFSERRVIFLSLSSLHLTQVSRGGYAGNNVMIASMCTTVHSTWGPALTESAQEAPEVGTFGSTIL